MHELAYESVEALAPIGAAGPDVNLDPCPIRQAGADAYVRQGTFS